MSRKDFLYPTDDSSQTRQAKQILFAFPGEGAPKSIINFMITLWKNILISFYIVDIDYTPFDADAIWRYTLKRFADLALAHAHEARTTQLFSISRGEDPPSLTRYNARLAPLATQGAEADFRFSGPLYDYLVEFNLERYTINRQRTEQRATIEEIRKNTKIGSQSCRPKTDKN
jgi:hypothetical protein